MLFSLAPARAENLAMSGARKPNVQSAPANAGDVFEGAGDFQPGELIVGTDYVVRKFLGEGGHASAYECENRIGKRVAVKVLHRHLAARADLVERMVVEARRTVQLRHRNIVEVHTAGMTGGDRPRAFIEMELLNGSNGRQLLLLKERLEVPHALDVLIDICHALDAAHRAGVVHQDLKPDNIFIHLDEWSGTAVTKLLDFGVARLLGQGHDGTFEGTLAYAAPEQLRGGAVAPTTDLYALGVIAFELITGRRPFEAAEARDQADQGAIASVEVGFFNEGDFTRNLVDSVLTAPPPRLCDFVRLPRALEDLVLQLLEKEPSKRPESAKAVANALQAIRQSPSLPKSAVTTQELLLHAAHAPKLPLVKGGTLRMESPLNGGAGAPDGATIPDAPMFEATPEALAAPTVDPPPLVPARGLARTPAPARDLRPLAPLVTDRLPSAPGFEEVRIEARVEAVRRPASSGLVGTFEPVVERRGGPPEADGEPSEGTARARRARRLVLASVGVAGVILVLGGVAATRRGAAVPLAPPSSGIGAASVSPAPSAKERDLPSAPIAPPVTAEQPSPAPAPPATVAAPSASNSPAAATGGDATKANAKPRRPSTPKPAPTATDSAVKREAKPLPGPGF